MQGRLIDPLAVQHCLCGRELGFEMRRQARGERLVRRPSDRISYRAVGVMLVSSTYHDPAQAGDETSPWSGDVPGTDTLDTCITGGVYHQGNRTSDAQKGAGVGRRLATPNDEAASSPGPGSGDSPPAPARAALQRDRVHADARVRTAGVREDNAACGVDGTRNSFWGPFAGWAWTRTTMPVRGCGAQSPPPSRRACPLSANPGSRPVPEPLSTRRRYSSTASRSTTPLWC